MQDEQLQQRWSDAAVEAGRTGELTVDALAVVGSQVTAVGMDREVLQRVLGTALLQCSDPWDVWYGRLKAYQEENGDCLVPGAYVTEDGFGLGTWVLHQRTKHKGNQGGLSEGQRSRLEELGMVWEPLEAAWEESARQLGAYREANGDCLVPAGYVTEDGFRLGQWVSSQRKKHKGKRGALSEGQRSRLEELGMVWDVRRNV